VDIGERIGVENHQVGEFALLQRAELIQLAAGDGAILRACEIAWAGVMPSSTKPSIAMMVPIPWLLLSGLGSIANSGAAAQ